MKREPSWGDRGRVLPERSGSELSRAGGLWLFSICSLFIGRLGWSEWVVCVGIKLCTIGVIQETDTCKEDKYPKAKQSRLMSISGHLYNIIRVCMMLL